MSHDTLFRISEHVTAPGVSHGDLFLLTPDAESLVTYDIQGLDLISLVERFQKRTDLEACLGEGEIWIKRKANHRLHYWTFSGDISGDRGTLREVCRGRLIEFPGGWPEATALKIYDVPREP
ncbi:MAG: hypothetical protein JNM27_14795 [Leptospirales bacterium]|nr:hypothetical protein [Leptospirales bacterium]